MKYRTLILKQIERAIQEAFKIRTGLESNTISPDQALSYAKSIEDALADAKEKIELEDDR